MPVEPDLAEVRAAFIAESREDLDQLEGELLALEADPGAHASLHSALRSLHSVKGTAGALGLAGIESIAHAGESLLSRLRDGPLPVGAAEVGSLLAAVDALREVLGHLEDHGSEGDDDHETLLRSLVALGTCTAAGSEELPAATSGASPSSAGRAVVFAPRVLEARRISPSRETPPAPSGSPKPGGERGESSVRVDVALLDRLMNLVGELVLARNQLVQHPAVRADESVALATQRLALITRELRDAVTKTRMQPIGTIWGALPRMVRDLAQRCGKEVLLHLEGHETELDRTIVEAVREPITHLVRNAVDHGLERPEERLASGKPRQGTLTVRAFHRGGYVTIEVADDGAGVDVGRLRARAVDHGLLRAEDAAALSERELVSLVFLPGLSTAATLSTLSGRGVGMDVVKTHVERIGGRVEIASVACAGSTIALRIPLTLAIMPALIVSVGAERYAIPQASLVELLRLDGLGVRPSVELVGGVPVTRRRGRLIPLVSLVAELAGSGERGRLLEGASWDRPLSDRVNVVVVQVDAQMFGLVVDAVNDVEEIVVKPLGALVKDLGVFAGATIMGDGRVALILDVEGVARRCGILAESQRVRVSANGTADRPSTLEAFLVLRVGDRNRIAVPLWQVERLERIRAADVELVGRREVVQCRGRLLPLLRLHEALALPGPPAGAQQLDLVISTCARWQVGVVVEAVVDVVERVVEPDDGAGPSRWRGLLVGGRATPVVDLQLAIESAEAGPALAATSS